MMFSVSFFKFMVLLFPLWVAAVSIVILLTARTPDSPAPAEPTAGVWYARAAARLGGRICDTMTGGSDRTRGREG